MIDYNFEDHQSYNYYNKTLKSKDAEKQPFKIVKIQYVVQRKSFMLGLIFFYLFSFSDNLNLYINGFYLKYISNEV